MTTDVFPEKNDIAEKLQVRGINPTVQRIEIARVMLARCAHLSADDVFSLVNKEEAHVSKATVYNTLGLFAEKGLVREVIVDPSRVFYDSNVAPHHHLFNVTTGELVDVEAGHMQVVGLPPLPSDTEVTGMDVVVRVRTAPKS